MLNKFIRCLSLSKKYEHVENDASYYFEVNDGVLDLFFEWSNGIVDWKNNFNFPAKPYRDMKDKWFCHRGFLKVWKSIEPYINSEIMNPEIREINIVGYSHGGAIAQLCYEYVKFNRPDVIVTGVGFGAPRVIWGIARKAVKERFKGFKVIRNGWDIVTHAPPVMFGFWHICKVTKVGKHWCIPDFVKAVKVKGFKKAFKSHDHIGIVKDHYKSQYIKGLRNLKVD